MNKIEITDKVVEIVKKANKIFGISMEVPDVQFFDKTLKAGYAFRFKNVVSFNTTSARDNSKDFEQTIAHEIAHKITWLLYPNAKQNHGPEFKRIMNILGYHKNLTYHSYDVSSVRKEYEYSCRCGIVKLSAIRHKRAQQGTTYRCNNCHTVVKFNG